MAVTPGEAPTSLSIEPPAAKSPGRTPVVWWKGLLYQVAGWRMARRVFG